jgi:transposase-like protein
MFRNRDEKKSLRGVVEIDETYVGGKPRKRKGAKPAPRGRGTNKTAVVGIVQRGGRLVARKIDEITKNEILAFLEKHVYNRSKLFTDDATYYTGLRRKYDHRKVIHKNWEWARKEEGVNIHTNTIESAWAIIKRALYGTFHHVSKHRLNMYLDEFCFRYNWRRVNDAVRFQRALDKTDGRLKWYFKTDFPA